MIAIMKINLDYEAILLGTGLNFTRTKLHGLLNCTGDLIARSQICTNNNFCQAIDLVQGGGKHHLTLYLKDTDWNSEGINYPYPPNIEGTDIILYHS